MAEGAYMTVLIPIGILLPTVCLWIAASLQGRKLLHLFRERHPREAAENIPFAFDRCRHPEKLFFFFRGVYQPLLRRDPVVWRLRQRVRLLVWLAIAVPPLLFALGLLMALRGAGYL